MRPFGQDPTAATTCAVQTRNHTGPDCIAHDARRRTVMESLGYRVVTVTNEQFADMRELKRVGLMVARELGRDFELAIDEQWVKRTAFHSKIRSIAKHPERLLS